MNVDHEEPSVPHEDAAPQRAAEPASAAPSPAAEPVNEVEAETEAEAEAEAAGEARVEEGLAGAPPQEISPGGEDAPETPADVPVNPPAGPVDVPASPPEAPPLPDHPRLRRHPVAPAMIALDRVDEDDTFQIRPEGDLSLLATDIARLGQLFPVDIRLKPPDRFQIICGFRRVAALRFLQRDRVLARLHTDLSDEDALLMALVSAIHAREVSSAELTAVKARLGEENRLTPSIRSMLDKALSPEDDLAPETVGEQEIDAEELAQDVTLRLGEINQDLSLLAEAFEGLDRARQDQLLEQLRYSSELVAYLEGRR